MGKNNRSGQAKILTEWELSKIRKCFNRERDKLLFDVLRYTGERLGCVIQLRQSDCFNIKGQPLDVLTFRANTRKASPKGLRRTRQVPIHPALAEYMETYELPPINGWLFPSRNDPCKHVTFQAADQILRKAIDQAGLGGKGISSHSFRRTLITRLDEAGVSLRTIQGVTGHASIASVQRYVEVSEERLRKAIELL